MQAAHRYPARGRDQAPVDPSARPTAAGVVRAAVVDAVPASRVALPIDRCRRDRRWAQGMAARPAPMAGGADRIAAARGTCPAVDSDQGRAAGHRLDPHGGLQVAMVVAAARAATDALLWRTAGARPRVWARQRFPAAPAERNQPAACAAPASRRGATVRPARPALCPARRPTPPDPSTQALAAGRRHGRSLQISPPAVRRRECRPLSVSTIPHQDTPSLGLPAACPLFRGGKTAVTVPMFDYCVDDLHACRWLGWGPRGRRGR